MNYICSMLLMIFLFPLHLFCQEDDAPKRSIGISAGKGFTLETSKKELKASSFELFAGPGLRNSKHSRWAAQFGFVYSRRDFTNEANSDEPAGRHIFWGLFYNYGRYFHISEHQGVYAYAGSGLGGLFFRGGPGFPMIWPEAGVNYRYSILFADLKGSWAGVILSFGLIY